MHAFLLAGGFATRLWPLTERRPKPLLPLAGKPMLSLLVEKIPAEIPVTVSTNAAFEDAFRAWVQAQQRPIDLVIEDTRKDDHKLGALGAIAQWITQQKIDDDLLVLTGDNYLGFSLPEFIGSFRGHPLLAAHDIKDLAKASAFGTVIIGQLSEKIGQLTSFEEKPPHPKSTLVSAGCAVLPKATLPILVEYAAKHPDNLGSIFEEYLRRGLAVDAFVFDDAWMDIGSFATYLEAHRFLVGEKALTDATTQVEQSELRGSVSIGAGSRVTNSTLEDCMVFDRCVIENCELRGCVIDDDCVLHGVDLRGKMLRAGTRLVVE